MQCYTNRHLRQLFRLLSARAVLWTEMEKAEDLLAGEAARDRRLRHDGCEGPLVLQLGGGDPASLAAAARLAIRYHRAVEADAFGLMESRGCKRLIVQGEERLWRSVAVSDG